MHVVLQLTLHSGTVLATAGPGPLLISFILVGMNVYLVMTAVGEMAAYLPQQSGFAGYAERFVDPAFGFSLGAHPVQELRITEIRH